LRAQQIAALFLWGVDKSGAASVTLWPRGVGSSENAIISVAANGDSAICHDGIPYALCDPGTAFLVNSGTTTTKITAYYTKGA